MNTKKIINSALCLLLAIVMFVPNVDAKKSKYIYRKRAEWVKVIKLSQKQMGDVALAHPVSNITTQEIQLILESVEMSKGSGFLNKQKIKNVFSKEEAAKYAPLIASGLKQAQNNQIVNLSIVHKRPQLIMRNDYLSIVNIYKTQEGLHLNFRKIFARLDGDYEQASNMDRAIRRAKSIRVGLAPKQGQKLGVDNNMEIIFDSQFLSTIPANLAENTSTTTKESVKTYGKIQNKIAQPQVQNVQNGFENSLETRLQKLESLKNKGLISSSEYKSKKKEILRDL